MNAVKIADQILNGEIEAEKGMKMFWENFIPTKVDYTVLTDRNLNDNKDNSWSFGTIEDIIDHLGADKFNEFLKHMKQYPEGFM